MQWTKVSPGCYERSFDSLEHFYRVVADGGAPLNKQHYLISCTLRLKILPPVHEVQNAWKALRKQYPQIAAMPDESGTRFRYSVPSSTELDAWVQETFVVDQGSSANDIYEKEQPSSLFLLFYLPQARELLFRVPHWRIDGIGLMYLQTAFLRILSNGPPEKIQLDGSEAKYLAPSLDQAAAVQLETTAATSKAADEELGVFLRGLPSISTPTLPNVIPTTPRRLMSYFSEETTQRIISACKSRGLTVTAAIHSALVVATLPYAQHEFNSETRGQGGGKYTGFNAVDLRKYLPVPYNGPEAAVSIYHTGIPVSIDLAVHKSFESIAAEFQYGYRRNLSEDEPRNIFGFLAEYVNKVLELLNAQPPDPLRAPAHPELSSIGLINDHLQAKYEGSASTIEVEEWWVAIEAINRLLLTNVWTWSDRMCLSVNWNEAFYEDSFVVKFLEEWKQTVLKELDIN